MDGNAYLNGAEVCKHERHFHKPENTDAKIELVEKDGKYSLKTNLYDFIQNFRDSIITSDTLGRAFEPEERFENPDGSEIVFNRDYFGSHRGLDTLPGPFASAEDAEKTLW